jgi:integrase
MARTKRSAKLDTRNARLKQPVGLRIHERISPGQYLGYRRPANGGSGSWFAKWQKDTKTLLQQSLGTADDFQDADGKSVLTYVQAQTEAKKWFQAMAARALAEEHGETFSSGSFTVADALNAYFKYGEQRGMKGLKQAVQSANARIIPILGNLEVARLTRKRIEIWLEFLAKSPKLLRAKKGQPQAYAAPPQTEDEKRARKDTANRILTILKAALNFASDRRLTNAEPCWQQVKPYRGTTSARIRFLQPNEATRLVNACNSDFRDLVRAALLTGARYSELIRLQCKDYNPNGEIPTIFIAESKSGKPRHVVLTPEGVALFEELTAKRQSPNDLIFSRQTVITQGRDDNKRFDGSKNEYKTSAWRSGHQWRFMLTACKAAGLEYISFHELRHTYATMLVNRGCPLVFVANQLGHTDTRMVEKHYGHLKDDAKAAAILAAMPTLGIVEPPKVTKLKLG